MPGMTGQPFDENAASPLGETPGDDGTGGDRALGLRQGDGSEQRGISTGGALYRPGHHGPVTLQIRMNQAKPKSGAKRVPNAGSWAPGRSGNPNGRPRSGLAFAEAVRERIDPHKVLDLMERHLADDDVPVAQRLATLLPYIHAGLVKPPTDTNIAITGATTDGASWDAVPLEARREKLAELRALREGAGSGEQRFVETAGD